MQIALFNMFPEWPLARQTPGGSLRWGDAAFTLNPAGGIFDACVVFDGLLAPATIEMPPDRSIFIAAEPPSIKLYHQRFLEQFATVVTCHSDTPHRRKLHRQQGYPWHLGVVREGGRVLGVQGFDDYARGGLPEKSKLLSVIVSDKAVTPGHRHRRAFVARLRQHFGDRIDVFGRGIRDLRDKAEGIVPYRYHVALENSQFPDYWTEKLADAFLGGAHPFYWGCPNVSAYFPEGSFTEINIFDPDAAIATIEGAIAAGRYESSRDQIGEARNLVLHTYNLFAACAELTASPSTLAPTKIMLQPERIFRDGVAKRLRRRLRRAIPRAWRKPEKPF